MKTLFILCTAVTVLQIFDVSITKVSAAVIKNSLSAEANLNQNTAPKKQVVRTVSRGYIDRKSTSVNSEPGINPNDDDSEEAEPPKTFTDAGKRVVKTAKKIATNRGVGLINGVDGFLKKTDGSFNFFGNILREQSNNVKDVAKESLMMVSDLGTTSSRGAMNVLNSARVVGAQGAKEMNSALQRLTMFGGNITKLGGAAVTTPISIGEDVVGTANRFARVPIKLSKKISNGAIKPISGFFGIQSDEEKKEEINEEEEAYYEEKKIKKPANSPSKRPVTQRRQLTK